MDHLMVCARSGRATRRRPLQASDGQPRQPQQGIFRVTHPDFFKRLRANAIAKGQSLLLRWLPVAAALEKDPSKTAFLDWSEVSQIGDPKIDEQHKLMVTIINRLHMLLVLGHDRSRADDLLKYFIDVVRNHFNHEESVLMENHCPGHGEHFDQHSKAMVEVNDLHRQFKAGRLSAQILLLRLRSWMVSHTKGFDRRHARYLSQIGQVPG